MSSTEDYERDINRLRAVLAYESRVLESHLSYKTFPKSRRDIAEKSIERMRAVAVDWVWSGYNETITDRALAALEREVNA